MTRERVRLIETGWGRDLVHEIVDAPPPEPSGNQVLVEVEACGVCHRDLLDREGRFPFIQLPITPGHEVVGRVIAVGDRVVDWKIGDRVGTTQRDACGGCKRCLAGETSLCDRAAWVLGILVDGGYASHLVLPESGLYAVPDDLGAPEAAVLQCTYGTAWRDLVTLGGLVEGEGQRVLVTGANGGVGAAAVDIAHRLGAHVTAVVRDGRHSDWLAQLGADEVVVDDGARFHGRIAKVDVALEAVGAPTFNSSLRSLRIGGRVVVVGNIVAEKVSVNLGYVITSGLSVIGGSGATRRDMAALLDLHRRSPLSIRIDRVLPLSRADEAQRAVRTGGLRGRVVVVPDRSAKAIKTDARAA
jgi:D-arabinose 1-dehydrogenase-like Zn-dependent alcohol dehydrogenase